MAGLVPILRFKQIQFIGNGGGNFHYLSKGISFSLYMTHGGTNWGHWAGANSPGFAPDVTSYDYDAPISESGQTTPKYWELRKVLSKYMNGEKQAVMLTGLVRPQDIASDNSVLSTSLADVKPVGVLRASITRFPCPSRRALSGESV